MTIVGPVLALVTVLGQPVWIAGGMGDFVLAQWKALNDGQRHWVTREQRMELTIVGRLGTQRRELVTYEKRASAASDGVEKRTIVFMSSPPEQRNTAFLARVFAGARPSEHWAYLPAGSKRPRQVSSSGGQESFMGSHLSYDDLDVLEALDHWPVKYGRATLVGSRTTGGVACHELALDVNSETRVGRAYSRVVLLLGQQDLIPRRLDLYAREDGALAKVVTQDDVAFRGRIPIVRRVTVEVPATNLRTEIATPVTRFDGALPDDLFEQSAMERGIPAS
jgi:hypothetical protein